MAQLLDARGNPIDTTLLRQEIALPTLTGVRSPTSGYPGDGLTPARLAQILRAADHGDLVQYLELAEAIEERDAHYVGVLGTRKRSVSQIGISVKPASDSARDVEIAATVEAWLERDELTDELFDILDAVGKGYSFTEIIWETSMGQWMPVRLEQRDQRWFRFDRTDLATPLMLDQHGAEVPLPGFKFVYAQMKAKTGLAGRSGIARIALWSYLFKKYTERDWAIFTQTFAQPLRVGKFGPNASPEDKKTLFQAVANIAGDCAAIMPESMQIDFVETSNLGTSHALYKERCDWIDQQISKAILGQTTTTDAIAGGHAVSKEHRQVQEDIERADAIALQSILNRDVIRPWVQLEFGPQERYPRLVIARPEQEDIEQLTASLAQLVPLGLRVAEHDVRAKLGLPEPRKNDTLLGQSSTDKADPAGAGPSAARETVETAPQSRVKYPFNTRLDAGGGEGQESTAEALSGPDIEPPEILEDLTDRLAEAAAAPGRKILASIEGMLAAAQSLEEFREMLLAGYPTIDTAQLGEAMAQAIVAAHAGGRVLAEDEADG